MTPSAHGAAGPWGGDAWAAEPDASDRRSADADGEYELLAQESPEPAWSGPDDESPDDWETWDEPLVGAPRGGWGRVAESTSEGLTGRGLILTTAVVAGACALLNLALTGGRVTFFFDLCFVVICLVATMAVRRQDLFTAGVLPPLLFAGVIAVVAIAAPQAFESAPGVNKVFLSGLASHAAGLVGGYGVALLAVAARMTASDSRSR